MIGLLAERGSYSLDALIGWSPQLFARIELPGLEPRAPYALAKIESGSCAVVGSGFLASRQPRLSAERLVAVLRTRFDEVVFWDHADPFQLDCGASDIGHFSRVVKINGTYRDPDLYNFEVGAPSPSGRWTEKTVPRPGRKYESVLLKTIRPGPPCFLSCVPTVRNRTRRLYQPWLERLAKNQIDTLTEVWLRLGERRKPRTTAHLVGSLTHVQRRDALRRVRKAGISLQGGITHVPPFVAGFGDRFGMASLDTAARLEIQRDLQAEGLLIPPRARPSYMASMLDCRAVVSITGYGEICFRMAEAWMAGRVLICQDLTHVRVDYPLEAGRNVIYCKPDLSDLPAILDDVEGHWERYRQIGEQGQADWVDWVSGAPGLMENALSNVRR